MLHHLPHWMGRHSTATPGLLPWAYALDLASPKPIPRLGLPPSPPAGCTQSPTVPFTLNHHQAEGDGEPVRRGHTGMQPPCLPSDPHLRTSAPYDPSTHLEWTRPLLRFCFFILWLLPRASFHTISGPGHTESNHTHARSTCQPPSGAGRVATPSFKIKGDPRLLRFTSGLGGPPPPPCPGSLCHVRLAPIRFAGDPPARVALIRLHAPGFTWPSGSPE